MTEFFHSIPFFGTVCECVLCYESTKLCFAINSIRQNGFLRTIHSVFIDSKHHFPYRTLELWNVFGFFTQLSLFCGGTSLFISNSVPHSFFALRLESATKIIIANDVHQNSWCSTQKPMFYLWLPINLSKWTEKKLECTVKALLEHAYSIISSTIKFSRTTFALITQFSWSIA